MSHGEVHQGTLRLCGSPCEDSAASTGHALQDLLAAVPALLPLQGQTTPRGLHLPLEAVFKTDTDIERRGAEWMVLDLGGPWGLVKGQPGGETPQEAACDLTSDIIIEEG